MRKSKSKSKTKASQNSKVIQNKEKENRSLCNVCRFAIAKDQIMLKCSKCNKIAHASCYNNQFLDNSSRKSFICDVCKYHKGSLDAHCQECGQYAGNQMLKSLGNPNDNKFVHVECALLTLSIEAQYSKMRFVMKNQKHVREQPLGPCRVCGEKNSKPAIKCILCPQVYHKRCFIDFIDKQYNFIVWNWLDKCEKYEFLLNQIFSKKKSNIKNLIEKPLKHKSNQFLICQKHSKTYTYCYCGSQILTQTRIHDDYQCGYCERWVHQVCSGLPPYEQIQILKCQGCTSLDKYKKQIKPNILFEQISLIQKSTKKLNEGSIRFLNSFPFKYSAGILKKINESMRQIQFYFIKKEVKKLIQELDQDENKQNRIIQLLLVASYGDKWKQFQNQLNKNTQKSVSIFNYISDIKKFQFSQLIQNKFKRLLLNKNNKYKVIKKQQIQIFKDQLRAFIETWKTVSKTNLQNNYIQLTAAIKKLQLLFKNIVQSYEQQDQRQFKNKFNKCFGNELFGKLIYRNISEQTILQILKKYGIMLAYLIQNREIQQQKYFKILSPQVQGIPQNQRQFYKQILRIIAERLLGIKIYFTSIKKQIAFKNYEKRLKSNSNNIKQLFKLKSQIIKKQICIISPVNIITAINIKHIQQTVLKNKIINICSVKDSKIRQQNFRDMNRIQQYLKKNNLLLSKKEQQCIQSYLGKLQFLASIYKKGEALQHYLIVEQEGNQNFIQDENFEKLSVIFLKIFHILDNWDQKILPSQFVINQMYRCVLRKVKFTNILIVERFQAFLRLITKRYQILLEEGRKINIFLLRKLIKILSYLKIQKEFPSFSQLYETVKKWSMVLPTDEQPFNISTFLEKPQKAINLLKIIDQKINTSSELYRVNLYSEINKLCLMRQWCRLSQKISLLSKAKPTINGVQALKNLLDRAGYPENIMFKKISQLEIESRNLNKQVVKFLQKPKAPQNFTFFQQIKFISNKMTIEQGIAIKLNLEICNLDVYVENQQLENQMRQFQQLPMNLSQQAEKRNLSQLNKIRRKLIDSSFRIPKIEQYQYFLKKIYALRCLNFEPPIGKQEYFQLLTVGGMAALHLQSQTSQLLRAYKTIERAQIQVSNQITKKRNLNNLLPINDQKYKQLKQDLKYDPNQLTKLQKARINNLKIRQQYMYLRTRKSEIEKYKQIEFQLTNSIFNNRDILNDILGLRNQLTMLVKKVQDIISYNLPVPQLLAPQNIFRRDRGIVEVYNNIKIRHTSLEKYQHDYRFYNRAQQIRQQINKDNYRAYCDSCKQVSEAGCKIPEFLTTRINEYFNMFSLVMNSGKAQHAMYEILIAQGLELRHLQSSKKQQIFTMVIQIYQKIRELQKSVQIQDNQISVQSQNQSQMNDQQQLSSDQDLNQIQNYNQNQNQIDEDNQNQDIDIDEYLEDSDQDSSPAGKSKGEDNHIVLDSD